jgi:hypothetical protein
MKGRKEGYSRKDERKEGRKDEKEGRKGGYGKI